MNQIPDRVHVIGAGGAGMSGLAKLLSQMGHTVTGSDIKPGPMFDALADVGVETWVGHRPERVTDAGLVVRSSAIPDGDPEIKAARDAGVTIWERPLLLSALTSKIPTLGFAGTHGKTTSTALAVAAFRGIGLDPTYLVGGELIGVNTGAHLGSDDLFVLEADEAFGTFRHLDIDNMLVTSIDVDHLDYYGTVAALEDAFAQVADRVEGVVVGCMDDHGVRRLAQRGPIVSYGFAKEAAWRIIDHEHTGDGQVFRLVGPDVEVNIELTKPGVHYASNASGVLALMGELGYDILDAAKVLKNSVGVRRRYEIRGSVAGVTIVDDYAHHPTEVAATIAAAVQVTEGKVVVVFQPHRYTRTAELGTEFGEPLSIADHVIVTDIYSAGEPPIIGVSGRIVADATAAAGGRVTYVKNLQEIGGVVSELVLPGDTVLILGAGDITSVAAPIASSIRVSS